MNTTFSNPAGCVADRGWLFAAIDGAGGPVGCQFVLPTTAQAQIYVSNWQTGVISRCSNSGAPIKPSFLTQLVASQDQPPS